MSAAKKVDNSIVGVYKGGTFQELIKSYAFERMGRDRVYRAGVHNKRRRRASGGGGHQPLPPNSDHPRALREHNPQKKGA